MPTHDTPRDTSGTRPSRDTPQARDEDRAHGGLPAYGRTPEGAAAGGPGGSHRYTGPGGPGSTRGASGSGGDAVSGKAGGTGQAPLGLDEPDLPAAAVSVTGTLVRVEAPMVGTFYRSPQPGAPSFVEVGDVVAPGQTLCILEAMKLMNEVKADVEGVVRAVHVENAAPVEFGQLLFELEPLGARPVL